MAIQSNKLRLGINIDHVATVRNARGGKYPDPVRAALLAEKAAADGITAHLREDRRHIVDEDIANLKKKLRIPLNLEIAATDEMVKLALKHLPHAVCIVPEKREERTTEGGLDVIKHHDQLIPVINQLKDAGVRCSLFIEPETKQVDAANSVGASVVEIHTGSFCETDPTSETKKYNAELERINNAATYGASLGLEIHAGHGLDYETVTDIAKIDEIRELNIGHFLIGEAIFVGLEESIRKMRNQMDLARATKLRLFS